MFYHDKTVKKVLDINATTESGLTQEEANEAVSKAKKGECVKALGADEIQELKNALTNVGLEY